MGSDPLSARLDAFTDAAFAFAVTLMVVGAGGGPPDWSTLADTLRSVPSFAIGFGIICIFWLGHVRWRGLRGAGGGSALFLTLLLVFTVLIYVQPLRAMSSAFANFLTGGRGGFIGRLEPMFVVYGLGFAAMSAILALLFRDAARAAMAEGVERDARGQQLIYGILALTGLASAAIALIPRYGVFAGFAYATLPLTIGLFTRRHKWSDAS